MEELENQETEAINTEESIVDRLKAGQDRFEKAVSLLEDCVLERLERHENAKIQANKSLEVIERMTDNVTTIIGSLDKEALEKFNNPEPEEELEPMQDLDSSHPEYIQPPIQ